MAHDHISPSAYSRWSKCPASPAMSKGAGNEASPEALEGTIAHALCAEAVAQAIASLTTESYEVPALDTLVDAVYRNADHPVEPAILHAIKPAIADPDMETAIEAWVTACLSRISADTIEHGIEDAIHLGAVTGRDAYGTADFYAINSGTLTVFDFKYGKGLKVEAENNGQLAIYALGLLDRHKDKCITNIELGIIQPRISDHPDIWSLPTDALLAFGAQIRREADLASQIMDLADKGQDVSSMANPGTEQCRWCKAKEHCPKLASLVTAVTPFNPNNDIDSLAVPAVKHMTGDELGRALPFLPLIRNWCDDVAEAAKDALTRGEKVPGFKLVQGRAGIRKWTKDAETVANGMSIPASVLYERKMISPTAAEKAAKAGAIGPRQWQRLKELITRSSGSPTVAPESDKRPAINVLIDFEVLEDDES